MELNFIAEGDLGALDDYRLELAINLDCHSLSKEKLQPTVPDVAWAQDKPSRFYPPLCGGRRGEELGNFSSLGLPTQRAE